AIISGAMLDPLAEHPAPYYYGYRAWQIHEKQRAEFRTQLVAVWRNGQLSNDPPNGHADTTGVAPARRILRVLNVLEHRDPAVWAADQRLAYLSVLRRCVASYGAIPKDRKAAAIAEKCYYHLSLFRRWEAVEKSRGTLTSRQVEKGLRWDGVHQNYRGHEFLVIRRYVKGLGVSPRQPSAR
ncbi:MAG: hypothetical protein ACYCUV_09395, partial [Phycisphaerae bacterium]